jgi:hypothetical protein
MAKPYTFADSELLTAAKINAYLNPEVPSDGDAVNTGWTDATGWLNAGYTSSNLEVCRFGVDVFWRGIIVPTTNWGSANADNTVVSPGGVPEIWRPPVNHVWLAASNSTTAAVVLRAVVNTNGALNVRCSAASNTSGVYFITSYRKLT